MVGLGGSNSAEKAPPAPKAKPATAKTAKTKPTDKKDQPAKQTGSANTNPGAIRPKSEPRAEHADRIDAGARVGPEHDQRRAADRAHRQLRQPLRRLALS